MPMLTVLLQTTPALPIDMGAWMQIASNNFFGIIAQAGPYLMVLMSVIVGVKLVPKLIHWLIGGN